MSDGHKTEKDRCRDSGRARSGAHEVYGVHSSDGLSDSPCKITSNRNLKLLQQKSKDEESKSLQATVQ